MADKSKGAASIPTWQQQKAEDVANGAQEANEESSTEATSPRSTLLEQAARFLEDDAIKDASTEKKREFLMEKGLSEEEMQDLFDRQASGAPVSAPASTTAGDLKTIYDSRKAPSLSRGPVEGNIGDLAPQRQVQEPTKRQQSQIQNRDVPPIITYPEFLLRSQKPPPLVTFQRLLYAIYGVSAITATAYGANKYLVEPMVNTLTESRHDLFSTTLALLEKLNQKLEANVSHIPIIPKTSSKPSQDPRYLHDDDDASSIASDPTELFHRDIATQTSPSLANTSSTSSSSSDPATSRPSSPSNDLSPSVRSEKYIASHTSRLNTIRSNLTYLLSIETPANTTNDNSLDLTSSYPATLNNPTTSQSLDITTQDRLRDLTSYLDALPFSSPSSATRPSDPYDFSARYGSGSAGTGVATKTPQKPEEDEVAKMKKEIRGLKGALLSSRNFPVAR